jgi:hypothetical protein
MTMSTEHRKFRRLGENRRRSFATAELSDEQVEAIRVSCVDSRHAHLDKMLDCKSQ